MPYKDVVLSVNKKTRDGRLLVTVTIDGRVLGGTALKKDRIGDTIKVTVSHEYLHNMPAGLLDRLGLAETQPLLFLYSVPERWESSKEEIPCKVRETNKGK